MAYQLVKVSTEAEWHDYHTIRRQVLWEDRGKTGYSDTQPDEYNPANHPLLLKLDGRSIGTTRLDNFGNGNGAVRLVAIVSDEQNRGHGRILGAMVEDYARQLGIKTLFVNAAPEAMGYYEKVGWTQFSWNEAELRGIAAECVQMRKQIVPFARKPAPSPR
jgi:N-acetylglutamate synthase-like GNAT family acetyltransferase